MAEDTSRQIGPVVLLGAPGAGKGTQARYISARFHIPHISTGDLLRENVRRGTELGKSAQSFMSRGELVTDSLVYGIVAQRLQQPDCKRGYILDGFPRTAGQAGWLDTLLQDTIFDNSKDGELRPEILRTLASKAENSRAIPCLPVVVQIEVDYNELLRRLTGRRTCPSCGRIYNVYLQPPRKDELCDVDGSGLVIRNDDREEVITERLKAYEEQTRPVADYYAARGRLHIVKGDRPVNEVTRDVFSALEESSGSCHGLRNS